MERHDCGTRGPARRSRSPSCTATPSDRRPSARTVPVSSLRAPIKPRGSGMPEPARSSRCSGAMTIPWGARSSARMGSESSRRASIRRRASGTRLFTSHSPRSDAKDSGLGAQSLSPTEAQLVATSPDGPPRRFEPRDRRRDHLPRRRWRRSASSTPCSAPTVATSSRGTQAAAFEPGIRPPAGSGARWMPKGAPIVAVPSPDATHILSLSVGSADPYHHGRPLGPHPQEARRDVAPRRPRRGSRLRRERTPLPRLERAKESWPSGTSPRAAGLPCSRAPALRAAALSPDGLRVVTGADDGVARIWDVAGGREVKRFPHAQAVVAVSFDADGKRLLTASADGTAKIWDTRTDRDPIALRGHQTEVTAASFDPTGRWVVTAESRPDRARLGRADRSGDRALPPPR